MNTVQRNIQQRISQEIVSLDQLRRKKRIQKWTITVLGACIAASLAVPNSGVALPRGGAIPLSAVEVGDDVLAGMRGRYVTPAQVVYFGVEMLTRWQTADGAAYNAGLYIGVDRSGNGFKPNVTILSREQRSPGQAGGSQVGPVASNGSISAGGIENVQGVGQSVQVTGDANGARNQITMNIGSGEIKIGAPSGEGWSSGTVATSDGNQKPSLGTQVGGGKASVSIAIPGQGIARQEISSLKGVQQQVQLVGSLNQVINHTTLIAKFNEQVSSQKGLNMNEALNAMHGLSVY